ncbi:MAG: FAD binding domain-containing protein [Xanthomonadaceae bacterium]|jgi:4-hydroxybenzoyl-CoA reductase subunit beta|nr:FAD binding domain-containing protein [Xanthomonadaceae bacterium]MDE3071114.1 FAD binding domain-containing protein [Pseudomonadota bacterium]
MNAPPARFAFERPASLAELVARLARLSADGGDYALAAGATDLMPQIKRGVKTPARLISLNGVPELAGVQARADGSHRLGALTRLADLAGDARLRQHYPALCAAAGRVASPPIRQRASLGGNLLVDNRCIHINQSALNRAVHGTCFKAGGETCPLVKSAVRGRLPQCQARFVSDTAPVLLLLDAVLQLVSPRGERQLPLSQFYRDDGMQRHVLASDEVLVAIELPAADGLRIDYDKLTIRRALDFPSLGVALGVRADSGGTLGELSLALTGIGTHPGCWRFAAAAYDNANAMLDAACAAARESATTYQQDFFPRDYRKRMIDVFIRKAAQRLGVAR